MNLTQIKDRIEKNIMAGRFIFSHETTTVTEDISKMLMSVFRQPSLSMYDIILSGKADILLTGYADIDSQRIALQISFCEENAGIWLFMKAVMPHQWHLFESPDRNLAIDRVVQKISMPIAQDAGFNHLYEGSIETVKHKQLPVKIINNDGGWKASLHGSPVELDDFRDISQLVSYHENVLLPSGLASIIQPTIDSLSIDLSGSFENISLFRFSTTSNKTWNLFGSEKLMLKNIQLTMNLYDPLHDGGADGQLQADFVIGNLSLTAKATYSAPDHNWTIESYFNGSDVLMLSDLLSTLPSLVGVDFNFDFLPAIKIKKLYFRYETRAVSEYGYLPEKALFDLESAVSLDLTEKFGIKNLGVEIHKAGSQYGLALKGVFNICGKYFPVRFLYYEREFVFRVDTEISPCILPSLSDFAQIIGLNLNSILPEELTGLGMPLLTRFEMIVDSSLKNLSHFSIAIKSTQPWYLLGLKKLCLQEYEIEFIYENATAITRKMAAIHTEFNIAGFLVAFTASNHNAGNEWIMSGMIGHKEKINLSDFTSSLADTLGLGTFALPIPDILLHQVSLVFNINQKSFEVRASVKVQLKEDTDILEKLFNLDASVVIGSVIIGGVRKFGGELKGRLQIGGQEFELLYKFDNGMNTKTVTASWENTNPWISPLSIGNLTESFGLSGLPDWIMEIDLGINKVELVYRIDTKRLEFSIISTRFGSIELVSYVENDKTECFLKMQFPSDISLAGLPLVGSELHLLDEVSVQNMIVIASTKEMTVPKVSRGISFCAVLKVMDTSFPIDTAGRQSPPRIVQDNSVAAEEGEKWFVIGKKIGPFTFSRIGVAFHDGKIFMLLDASLTVSPIGIHLMALGLGFAVAQPKDMQFTLSGIGVDYTNSSLSIKGALMRLVIEKETSYDGSLLIKAAKFSLFAIGSYSNDSMYAFAILEAALGGPPVFFITGLAAGFGYNRNLQIPSIDKVADFPLIQGAKGRISSEQMARSLKSGYIKAQKGQHFLAAGIMFTSFKMINSFALATFSFGNRLEIGLLGLAEVSVPPNLPPKNNPIAYAQLALKASYSPETGIIEVLARLTSESYILSRDCKLTGGFAFVIWTTGEHAGDFVITLGGYHRKFHKPAHYPDVPRLGFNWNVTRELSLSGELYFALTPSCIMAGGGLSAVYQSGALKAWFYARADFLLSWKPFHYDIQIAVGLGASYRVDFWFIHKTFTVELSADLSIWGPEFSGKAKITWYIISFTIKFGNSKNSVKPINWDEFKQSFLPKKQSSVNNNEIAFNTISISEGLLEEGIIHPAYVEIILKSAVPCTSIDLNGKTIYQTNTAQLGVLPMACGSENAPELQSLQIIKMERTDGAKVLLDFEIMRENLPRAIWGLKKSDNKDEQLIKQVVTGIVIRPKQIQYDIFPKSEKIDLAMLSIYEQVERTFDWNEKKHITVQEKPQSGSLVEFSDTVMSYTVAGIRNEIINDLKQFGIDRKKKISLTRLADQANNLFYEQIKICYSAGRKNAKQRF